MAKQTSGNGHLSVVAPAMGDLIRFDPPRALSRAEQRVNTELAIQTAVIGGHRIKIEHGIDAVAGINRLLHREWADLADEIAAIQREERDPGAQRWVSWFVEQLLPQAGADFARMAHTGAYNIGVEVGRPLYPNPEPPRPLSLLEKLIGARREE